MWSEGGGLEEWVVGDVGMGASSEVGGTCELEGGRGRCVWI